MEFWIKSIALVIAMIGGGIALVMSYEPVKSVRMGGGWTAIGGPRTQEDIDRDHALWWKLDQEARQKKLRERYGLPPHAQ